MPGDVFAGCRIEEVAGRGGMGVVYRATQLSLDRTVALKVIAPHYASDPGFRDRFSREARLAASIDHPGVAPVHDFGEVDGVPYLVMAFIPGDDLEKILARDGRIESSRAARIVAQVGAALQAAHDRGLVHRDVKPANIMVTPVRDDEERIFLTDFGLTRPPERTNLTAAGQFIGTPDYMAPEQLQDLPITGRVDVYSLGCMLYEMLTGEIPYASDSTMRKLWAHVNEPIPVPSAKGAPVAFDAVVARALAKDPNERFATPTELGRAALAAVPGGVPTVVGEPVPTPAATIASTPPSAPAENAPTAVISGGRRSRTVAITAGALVLFSAGAVGAVLLTRDDDPTGSPTTGVTNTAPTANGPATTATTPASTPTPPPPSTPTTPTSNAPTRTAADALLDRYERAYSNEDPAALGELLSLDVHRVQVARNGETKEWFGLVDVIGEYERQFAENDKVVYRVKVDGVTPTGGALDVDARYQIDNQNGQTIGGEIDFTIVSDEDEARIADIRIRLT